MAADGIAVGSNSYSHLPATFAVALASTAAVLKLGTMYSVGYRCVLYVGCCTLTGWPEAGRLS